MRALAVALAAALVPIGLAGPAVAEKGTDHDTKYDVLLGTPCDTCPTPTTVPPPYAPFQRCLDIRRLTVDYRPTELRLTTEARLYEQNALPYWIGATWRLKGADGQYWDVGLSDLASPLTATLSQDNQPTPPCDGLRGKILLPRKAWKVIIPASCLGTPRWVRAGGQLVHADHTTFTWVFDDAVTSDPEDAGLLARLGGKVHRG